MDKAKEIKAIMKDLDCTEAEAEEVFAMEEKARKNHTNQYVSTEKNMGKKPKVRKSDDDKIFLIQHLKSYLENITNPNITNKEREITFTFNGNDYSVTLVKHRPPKEK